MFLKDPKQKSKKSNKKWIWESGEKGVEGVGDGKEENGEIINKLGDNSCYMVGERGLGVVESVFPCPPLIIMSCTFE